MYDVDEGREVAVSSLNSSHRKEDAFLDDDPRGGEGVDDDKPTGESGKEIVFLDRRRREEELLTTEFLEEAPNIEGNARGEGGDDAPNRASGKDNYTEKNHEPGDGTRSLPEAWRAYFYKEEEVNVTERYAVAKVSGLLKLCAMPRRENLGTGREDDPRWDDVRRFLHEATHEEKKAAAEEMKFGRWFPLLVACGCKPPVDVVKALLDASAETVHHGDDADVTPLHMASSNGASEEVIRLLIDRGGGKDVCLVMAKDGSTPLHCACAGGASDEVVRLLIDMGGGKEACLKENKMGWTPLHVACLLGAPEKVVRLLIDKGGGKEACLRAAENGFTPLHFACSKGRASEDVVRLLIDRGGGGEVCLQETADGNTPLHLACYGGAPEEVISLLIEKGGGIACKRAEHDTGRFPLLFALRYHRSAQLSDKTLRLVIKNGGMEPLRDLLDVSVEQRKKCLCFKETREALNRGFTERPVLALMMLDLYFQGFLVAMMSLATNQSLEQNGGLDTWQLLLLVLGVSWFSIRELMQMKTSSYQVYVSDFWNWLDISQIILVSVSVAEMNSGKPITNGTPGQILLTVTVGIVWLALLGVMKNFLYDIAVFVTSLQQILIKLVPFLVVTTVTITAFVFMFRSTNINASYCESIDLEEKWYCGMIGHLYAKLSSFVLGGLEIEMNIIEENGTTAGILYAFGVIIALIFLNVLIAKISNVFSAVERSGNEVFWTNRFNVVIEAQLVLKLLSSIFTTGMRKEAKKRTRFSKVIFFADGWKITGGPSFKDKTPNVQNLITRPQEPGWDFKFSEGSTRFLCQELHRFCCRLFVPILILVFFVTGFMSCGVLWPKWMTQWLFFGKEDSSINELDTVSDKMAQLGGRIESKMSDSEEKAEIQMKQLVQRVTVIESKILESEGKANQMGERMNDIGERMKRMEKKLDNLLEAVVKLNERSFSIKM